MGSEFDECCAEKLERGRISGLQEAYDSLIDTYEAINFEMSFGETMLMVIEDIKELINKKEKK